MSEKKVTLRWSQHPLISAMLWILGTEGTETPDSQQGAGGGGGSNTAAAQNKVNVAWKDQHGGNIHEYITQVQSVENKDQSSSSSSMEKESSSSMGGTLLYPRTFYAQERNNNSDVYHTLNNHHHHPYHTTPPEYRSNSKDISYGDLVDESPQWGFYVPITPPQPEVYAAMAKEINAHAHKSVR